MYSGAVGRQYDKEHLGGRCITLAIDGKQTSSGVSFFFELKQPIAEPTQDKERCGPSSVPLEFSLLL